MWRGPMATEHNAPRVQDVHEPNTAAVWAEGAGDGV